MPPRHVRNHCTWRDRFGNDPRLLLVIPPPPADNARYFRAARNNLCVVINVDHNVHTFAIPRESRWCTARTPLS